MGNLPEVVLLNEVPENVSLASFHNPDGEVQTLQLFHFLGSSYALFVHGASEELGTEELMCGLSISCLERGGWEFLMLL